MWFYHLVTRLSQPSFFYMGVHQYIGASRAKCYITANQTFLFVSDSTKLDRTCNSDVYSVLRTKAEVFLMTVYASIHVNR